VTEHPIDKDVIVEFCDTIFRPEDWVELRALRGRGGGHTQFVKASDIESVLEWVQAHNGPSWACYVGPNPRHSKSGSGPTGAGTDQDVANFRSVFVDFDDANLVEAMRRITEAGIATPTLLIESGRATGTHAYWCLRQPIEDADEWRGVQAWLIRTLSSDKSIKNPGRIMRLPGTFNHKRGAACRIVKSNVSFDVYTDAGVQRDEVASFEFIAPDANIAPDDQHLNMTTLKFLHEPTPEGERNNRLIAAALDFNANNYPVEDALNRLVSLAVDRDGLDPREAERTVRSGYARPASPTIRAIGPEVSMADLMADLNGDRGGSSPGEAGEGPLPDVPPVPVPSAPSETPDLPDQSPRLDGLPADPRDRPHVSNVATRVVMDNGRRRVVTVYKTIDQVGRDMSEALGGWPRRSKATGPFAVKQTEDGPEIWSLFDANDLFALLHDRATVRWARGDCESELGDTLSAVTKTEYFKWIKDNITPAYDSISELPHVPPRPGIYYLPVELPKPTGEKLNEFLAALNPATETDRKLILAALMTPGWGGPPGARPVFVIASDHGQGSGKTETAKAIGRVWGGAAPLDYEDNWQSISKRIMSSDDWLSRVFLFDNVKGKFGGAAIEAAVTSENLTGHKLFVGTVKRPNDATFLITFNMPEMTRDLAQRAVIIKLGQPRVGDFVEWAQDFINENRMQLISDLLDLLRQPSQGVIDRKHRDRWGAWQRDVLSRVPDSDPDKLAADIIERRPVADAEAEEASDIVQAVSGYLQAEGRKVVGEAVSEISSMEIVKVMEDAELWNPNEQYSAAANARKCISIARGKLLGRGVLMPIEVPSANGNRPKRVRVDTTGRPTRHRSGKQSIVYGWVWEKASQIYNDDFDAEEPTTEIPF